MPELDGSAGGRCDAEGCAAYSFLLYRCGGCEAAFCEAHAVDHAPCRDGNRAHHGADGATSGAQPTCAVCGPVEATALLTCETCDAKVCVAHRFHTAAHGKGAEENVPAGTAAQGNAQGVPTSRMALGTTKGARLQLGSIGARGSAEGLNAPVSAALVALAPNGASLTAPRFVVLSPQWVLGRLVDTVCDMTCKAEGKAALGIDWDMRVLQAETAGIGVALVEYNAATKSVELRPLELRASLTSLPKEPLLVLGVTPALASPPATIIADLQRVLQRVSPLAFYVKAGTAKPKADDAPKVATAATQVVTEIAAASNVPTVDDSATPFAALLTTAFTASKLKALGAKEAGPSSIVIAVYVFDLQSSSPSPAQIAQTSKRGASAACVRVSPHWSVGRVLDAILSLLPPPVPALGTGADRLRLVHLRQPQVLDNSATASTVFKNGDAVALSPGGVIPASTLHEAVRVAQEQTAGKLPQAAKLKIQKDCVVM